MLNPAGNRKVIGVHVFNTYFGFKLESQNLTFQKSRKLKN